MTKPYDEVRDSIMGVPYSIEDPNIAQYIPRLCAQCDNPLQLPRVDDCEFTGYAVERFDELLAGGDIMALIEGLGFRPVPGDVWFCRCNGCLNRAKDGRPLKYCGDDCRKAAAAKRRKIARAKK